MTKLHDENGESKVIIGESTPIKIGLVILLLGVFGSAIYWAGNINSKLDNISATMLSFQTSSSTSISELKAKDASHDKDIGDIKLQMALSDVEIKSLKDKMAANSQSIKK